SSSVRSGLLSTAGNLLFAGDASANFVAFNATTGETLWHSRLHASITNAPITYELDGVPYVVVGAGDSLYAFALTAIFILLVAMGVLTLAQDSPVGYTDTPMLPDLPYRVHDPARPHPRVVT